MRDNRLFRFITVRVATAFIILAVLDLMFNSYGRWTALLGLALGGGFSLIRLNSSVGFLSEVLLQDGGTGAYRKSIGKFIINQMSALALMAASVVVDLWLFIGVAAGILLVPFVIFINCITEVTGITHNNFE